MNVGHFTMQIYGVNGSFSFSNQQPNRSFGSTSTNLPKFDLMTAPL